MLRQRRIPAFLVLLALVSAACARGGDAKPPETSDRTIPRKLTVRVSGAKSWEFSGTEDMRFVVRPAKGKFAEGSVASVTLRKFLEVSGDELAQPEVAVVGVYSGDGTFTLSPGRGTKPGTGPTVPDDPNALDRLSVTQVTFDRKSVRGQAKRFDYPLQPCKVVFSDDATTGSASCLALATHTGETISFEMSWGKP